MLKAIWEISWMENNKFLSYSLVREKKWIEHAFHNIRRAQSWLDGYNNEGDVADSENGEIVKYPYGS